jgi:transcriptional regulator with XRE-family HTH domain
MNAVTATESRALELLGQGISQEQVALALGVTPSAISQLMSRDEFAARVQELRFQRLQQHNERDATLDALEDSALQKLKDLLPLVMKPIEATRILQVVNAAKRRGASAPESITQTHDVVSLTLPIQLVQQFQLTVTPDNRVVSAGEQQLITVQSHKLPALLAESQGQKLKEKVALLTERKEIENGSSQLTRIASSSSSVRGQLKEIDL